MEPCRNQEDDQLRKFVEQALQVAIGPEEEYKDHHAWGAQVQVTRIRQEEK